MTTTERARSRADRRAGRRAAASLLAALALALGAGMGAAAGTEAAGETTATTEAAMPETPDDDPGAAGRVGVDGLGAVTGLPIPRYVSLKATKANVRRGPGMTHRVDWVFMRKGMPLEVIGEYGHWRRVRDPEGASGWLHYSMIRGNRTAIVTAETADLHLEPGAGSPVTARAEQGVVLQIDACTLEWCEVERDGVDGWAAKADLWGVGPAEVFD